MAFMAKAARAAAAPVVCEGGTSNLVADHAWVGVLRMAPGCDNTCDGWCDVYDGRYDELNITARAIVAGVLDASVDASRGHVNYGCWFYTMWNASAYSGAFVNVGRSLRVTHRCEVSALLYGTAASANKLCTSGPGDKLWCTFARAHGYDSIQVARGTRYYGRASSPGWHGRTRPWSELVLCSDDCGSRRFSADANVPAARSISSTDGAVRPCESVVGAKELVCDPRRRYENLTRCDATGRSPTGVHWHGLLSAHIDREPRERTVPPECRGEPAANNKTALRLVHEHAADG